MTSVSSDVVGEQRQRYWSLVVAGCEWRAMGIEDPEVMAEMVFSALDPRKPGLNRLFREIDKVVAIAYRKEASQRSSLDALRQMATVHQDSSLPDALVTLSTLREADRRILQLAYWDDLEPLEISEVLGVDLVDVFQRLARATSRLTPKLARKGVAADDVEQAIRDAKPGRHHRR